MMPFKPLPQTDPKLTRLLKEAAEKYNAMTPAEREATHDEQRKSWVRAETSWPKPRYKFVGGVKVYESYEDYIND